MKSIILAVAVLSATTALAKLNVVTTTADLAAVAREIGGDQLEITSLAKPTEDPHFVEPKPSLIVKLRNADVLIEGGADLEIGWLPALVDRSANRKIQNGPGRVKANEGVQMLEIPGTMDRSQGDLHAAGNPHFMVDPANAEIVARHFAEVFSRLDPKEASHYAAGLDQFLTRLKVKRKEWEEKVAPFKGQTIVGYHSAWPYFARRFGLKIDLFLEPKPGLPATPAHLAEVINEMKKRGAKVVIVDAYLDRRTAEVVANRTGAVVVDVTHFPGGVKGTEAGYIQLIDYLVNAMTKGLGR